MKKKILTSVFVCFLIGIAISPATISINQNNNQTTPLENQKNSEDFLLDFYIQTLMKIAHKPSVATCIIKDGMVAWEKGYGYYDIENQKETNKDILYLQVSVSKTVTATALMQLYEQGLFDLDDDVNKYLPFDLRNPNHPDDPITIKMLLSHRTSLADDNLYWIAL